MKIVKQASDQDHAKRPRLAKAYRSWVSPDFRHQGVRLIYAEKFNALLPNDFFWNWYKPLRDTYAHQAGYLMQKELAKIGKKDAKELEVAIAETGIK